MRIIKPGEEAYAISRYADSTGDTDHVGIYKVVVESYTVDESGVTYWLKTPKGELWGDSVLAEEVNKNRMKLIKKMIEEWDLNENW